ncbi:protein ROOT HAIR DEFECTIVE 3 homolog 2-like [Prunus yedoensis var. nudiflora]|uniref:Protein ROOT HAIR DEFECTIVE 3 homolog 2-like n=1 Tax=Prunus yedoensis var. nudiflora TaxID=2094558 RepID=A0A314XVK7_PRUYE|nr:protein ROOT HAIR DEFECTIVE 3 homolog 2-like [Prunus yedoensis var. nudiflora]
MLGHLCSKILEEFKVRLEKSLKEGSFDSSVSASCIEFSVQAAIQNANWDSSSIRKKLVCDIDALALRVHDVKLSELKDKCEKQLSTSLTKQVEALLEDGREDGWASIRSILRHQTEEASLKILSVMAAICLDDDGTPNNIKKCLFSSLIDETKAPKDPLASNTWEGVSQKDTLITPVGCKSLWEKFILETRHHVTQATSARDTGKKLLLAEAAIALTNVLTS